MEIPNLRNIRQRKLLTQTELATRAGLTTASISRLETGASKARISTVRRLSEALQVDASVLLDPTITPAQTSVARGTKS
ncbi:MAG: helix-turn-helix domain-containing protein [Thermomicrobiales bacterium]